MYLILIFHISLFEISHNSFYIKDDNVG